MLRSLIRAAAVAAALSLASIPALAGGPVSPPLQLQSDPRFPASVSGLRKGAGAGGQDVAATAADIANVLGFVPLAQNGSGAALTGLNAGAIGSGTLAAARLPAVPGTDCSLAAGGGALSCAGMLGVSHTFTVPQTFAGTISTAAGGGLGAALSAQSSAPYLSWSNTSAATDNKTWQMGADTTALYLGPVNDANTLAPAALTILRSGATIAGITLNPGTGSLSVNDSSIAWGTSTTASNYIHDVNRVVLGNYPISGEFGSAGVSTTSALVGAADIPSNSSVYQAMGVAGYARNASATTSAVATFGQITMSGNSLGGDAVNGVATNGPLQTSTTGYNIVGGALSPLEGDANILPVAGGGAPAGNVYGSVVTGGSKIQPLGLFDGYNVHPAGPGVRWKVGLNIIAGAADAGIQLGALNATGTSSSQPIVLNFNNGTNNLAFYAMQADAAGNLLLNSYSGGAVIAKNSAGTTLFSASVGSFNVPVLAVTSNIIASGLPTAASGSVKGSACVDTTGNIYVKTTTGSCL